MHPTSIYRRPTLIYKHLKTKIVVQLSKFVWTPNQREILRFFDQEGENVEDFYLVSHCENFPIYKPVISIFS